jgi:hypothetical protein
MLLDLNCRLLQFLGYRPIDLHTGSAIDSSGMLGAIFQDTSQMSEGRGRQRRLIWA